MASLTSLYFKKETLEVLLKTIEKKGDKGVEITVSIGDETNKFGQNVSAFVSQTKEQREAKKDRYFVANGKVFWCDQDGRITVAKKPDEVQQTAPQSAESDDLPF